MSFRSKALGLNIHSCHLGVFHPDYDRYHVVDLPYLSDEVDRLIEYRIQKICIGV